MSYNILKKKFALLVLTLSPVITNAVELAPQPENYRIDSLPPMIAEALAQLSEPRKTTTPAYITEFEQYISQTVAPKVPGAALLVVADGKVQIMNGYGVREAGSTDPVTPDTVFRLASVSKTIASSAAAVLVGQQQLMWDSPINKSLAQVRFKNPRYTQQITVGDILSHTTGLAAHTYSNLIENNVPYQEAVNRLSAVRFACPPKSCYGYQNVVFSLIGDVIQKISGNTYEDFVTARLFKPLGMASASFGLESLQKNTNYARPHIWRRGKWTPTEIKANYYNIAPAAGANASIKDMSFWMLAHLGQRQDVLSDNMLNDMQSKIIKTSVAGSHYGVPASMIDTYYGLGWRVFDFGAHKNFVHHGGWVKGFRAEMVFNRELQIGMVFLTNSETRLAKDVIFNFVHRYEGSRQQEVLAPLLRAEVNTLQHFPSQD